MTQMKLALAQINTVLGDLHANLEMHLRWIEQARQQARIFCCFQNFP